MTGKNTSGQVCQHHLSLNYKKIISGLPSAHITGWWCIEETRQTSFSGSCRCYLQKRHVSRPCWKQKHFDQKKKFFCQAMSKEFPVCFHVKFQPEVFLTFENHEWYLWHGMVRLNLPVKHCYDSDNKFQRPACFLHEKPVQCPFAKMLYITFKWADVSSFDKLKWKKNLNMNQALRRDLFSEQIPSWAAITKLVLPSSCQFCFRQNGIDDLSFCCQT